MNIRIITKIYLITLLCASVNLQAQDGKPFDPLTHLHQAEDYFDMELYGQARREVDHFVTAQKNGLEIDKELLYSIPMKSIYHISGLRMQLPDAETEMVDFLKENKGNPFLDDALFEMGDFLYNAKRYKDAISYFDQINLDNLETIKMSELAFKNGYCHFVHKNFKQAMYNFSYSNDIKNKYFYPINYYYGMAKYYTDDYDAAISSFRRVESSSIYKDHIPYYIAQIYFKEEKYDQLINYGTKVIENPSVQKKADIQLLLGQTYFMKNEYERALPYLEYYEEHSPSLTKEEFYQLAFAQYQLKQYDKAKENFLELTSLNSRMGQVSNYYLADCYEKTGDKTSARAAFKKVSAMSYLKPMQEEATFNYGKLSSELGHEREAINILTKIDATSPYYKETQFIINDILKNTSDYDNALRIMDNLPSLNDQLKTTYQKMSFNRALQYYNEGNYALSRKYLNQSQKYPFDPALNAQTHFWLGKMQNQEGNYKESMAEFQEYFGLARSGIILPEESSLPIAYYYQGYNNLKQNKYREASVGFSESVSGIQSGNFKNQKVKQRLLADAVLRSGDSYFKVRNYRKAKKYYNDAIDRKYPGYAYPLYQRSVIEGLEGKRYEQIKTLQTIRDDHPRSEYADDALLQLGDAYYSSGNNEAAELNLKKLVRDYENSSDLVNAARIKLGLISYNDNRADEALAYYKEVVNKNPTPKEKTEALGAIEEIYIDDLGSSDDYIAYVDSIPGIDLSDITRDSISYKSAELQFRYGEYGKAIPAYTRYLSSYPQGYFKLPATYERAESYASMKQYDEALKDYDYLINKGINEYYERSLKKAALISYNHAQDFKAALQYNKKLEARSQDPNDKYIAQLNAMRSAFRIGNSEEVIAYAQKVIDNPLVTSGEKSAALYYLAKVSYARNELDQAYSGFQRASALARNNQGAESLYMLAKIKYDQGMKSDAARLAREANDKNGAYPFWIAKSLMLISDIYMDNGDMLNARAAVEAVIENFKSDADLTSEAQTKLARIEEIENKNNRIRPEQSDDIMEMDTIKNK